MQDNAKGWDVEEIRYLQNEIERCIDGGLPLSNAFMSTAKKTKRNQSSVRNFYYTYLRAKMLDEDIDKIKRRENTEFDTFSQGEVYHLVKYIIMGISGGKSIRQCSNELSNGDTKLMLRYQNKYRSVIKRRKTVVERILKNLDDEGFEYISPYKKENSTIEKAYNALKCRTDLAQYIKSVNLLFDSEKISSSTRKNLIYTKAMVDGEYNKMQQATMLYEFYQEKLDELIEKNVEPFS